MVVGRRRALSDISGNDGRANISWRPHPPEFLPPRRPWPKRQVDDAKPQHLLTFRLCEILSEQPVAPEGFVASGTLAQLLRCEAGVPPHLPDHVRLVGEP